MPYYSIEEFVIAIAKTLEVLACKTEELGILWYKDELRLWYVSSSTIDVAMKRISIREGKAKTKKKAENLGM